MVGRWEPGELIVRREVLGLGPHGHRAPLPEWHGRPWEAVPVYVVEDASDQLVAYLPERAEIGFADGDWPTPDGTELDAGRFWWDPGWARWAPPAEWTDARLPADWSSTPCPGV